MLSAPSRSLAYICKQRNRVGKGLGARLARCHNVSGSQSRTEHLNEVRALEETSV